ncbi:MAG: gliding motility-associated C-terminal domain-containing protein, partial [Chitinophagaceae bacterium]
VTYASSDATVARIIGGNQLEILRAGTVTITASQPGNANYSAAAPVLRQLRIIENPAPVIAITSSRGASISKGETSVLTATGAVAYVWTTASGIVSGQNSASLSVRPSVSTTYTVTGTNQFGRSSTASFRLEVRSDFQALKATNVMTPNGDGVNDLWVVENIDLYPENQVTIIDRAGRSVLKVKGYQNNWDATLNGLPLDQGTYYYIIDFGKGFGLQKGFISVVRGK